MNILLIFLVVFILFLLRKLTRKLKDTRTRIEVPFEIRKGRAGERYIAKILQHLDENEYKVLNDVLLKRKNGKTNRKRSGKGGSPRVS
ncbi:MAG: hypothetical protein P1P64_08530 [Treponemataceae bacterium]